jgi:hypothetical protein
MYTTSSKIKLPSNLNLLYNTAFGKTGHTMSSFVFIREV